METLERVAQPAAPTDETCAIVCALSLADLADVNRVRFESTRRFGADYRTSSLQAETLAEMASQGWAHGLRVRGALVGVCYGAREGCEVHLEFLGVSLVHQGRGYGTRLLEHLCTRAAGYGVSVISLVTSGSVPWNRPYYESLGFHALAGAELSPALAARCAAQAELFGAYPLLLPRVAMARPIPGAASTPSSELPVHPCPNHARLQ